jgi:hypothetical protein
MGKWAAREKKKLPAMRTLCLFKLFLLKEWDTTL